MFRRIFQFQPVSAILVAEHGEAAFLLTAIGFTIKKGGSSYVCQNSFGNTRGFEELNRRLRELGFVEKLPPSAYGQDTDFR